MARTKKETSRVDEMLNDLLADCQTPEEILGKSGLLQQLSQRLIERALVGELNFHLKDWRTVYEIAVMLSTGEPYALQALR